MTDVHHEPSLNVLKLEPGEAVVAVTRATAATMLVTNKRLAVAAGERLALEIPYERLRRIQFDIERSRPATLVIVPERPSDEPQVLAIPAESYEEAARALAIIGERLHKSA